MSEQSRIRKTGRVQRRAWLKTTLIAVGIALGVYVIIGVLLAGHETIPMPSGNQPMLIKGGEVYNHRISLKSWSFEFDDAKLSPDGGYAVIENLHDGVFYKRGKPLVRVSAEHATVNTSTYDFTASGKVHIERIGTDQSFDTDSMMWTNANKILRLERPSYIRTGSHVLKIEHAAFDLNKNTLSVGSIDGSINP